MITVGSACWTGEHAVYPGPFDPVTPGHLGIMERARHLFTRITVLVAVSSDKQPAGSESERAAKMRLPARPGLAAMSSTVMRGLGRREQKGCRP